MLQELKNYSSIGNRDGILLLCSKTLSGNDEDIASITTACSFINGVNLNLRCGFLALDALGLLILNDTTCKATNLIYTQNNEDTFVQELCRHCISCLIGESWIDCSKAYYSEDRNCFMLPVRAFKLESAVFRNMLISLNAFNVVGNALCVDSLYENYFTSAIKEKKKVSQEQLLEQLNQQRLIGEAGESFVLQFEKERCQFSIDQLKHIKQISIVDVSAGYDIIYFHSPDSLIRRYIEVKTFVGECHFNWSVNEIESAKLRGDNYYLYLVDYNMIKKEGYEPQMIKNPYNSIVGSPAWKMEPTSYYISPQK